MTDYNAKVVLEQGASVLRVDSAGVIDLRTGGVENVAGSMNISSGGYFALGNSQFLFGAATDPPTVTASPGAFYFRTDGSASNFYVNTSDGTAGSVWAPASISRP